MDGTSEVCRLQFGDSTPSDAAVRREQLITLGTLLATRLGVSETGPGAVGRTALPATFHCYSQPRLTATLTATANALDDTRGHRVDEVRDRDLKKACLEGDPMDDG